MVAAVFRPRLPGLFKKSVTQSATVGAAFHDVAVTLRPISRLRLGVRRCSAAFAVAGKAADAREPLA